MSDAVDTDQVATGSIWRLAASDVPRVTPGMSAAETMVAVQGTGRLPTAHVAVLEEGVFLGVVPPERLLQADPAVSIETLVDHRIPCVAPNESAEGACWAAAQAGVGTIAVVEADGAMRGLVPPRRLVGLLAHEHEVDLARLGGYLRASTLARVASTEPVRARFLHRLPWLLVGLGAALVSALLVSGFEESLERNVALAFFLPGVVYMADAIGTQTETLVLRGLSVGIEIRRVLAKELATGLVMGVVLAAVFYAAALGFGVGSSIALVVALALLGGCTIATGIAMVLPALLSRLGSDPAFGSGPLATVVQDLLSITVYLGLAVLILP